MIQSTQSATDEMDQANLQRVAAKKNNLPSRLLAMPFSPYLWDWTEQNYLPLSLDVEPEQSRPAITFCQRNRAACIFTFQLPEWQKTWKICKPLKNSKAEIAFYSKMIFKILQRQIISEKWATYKAAFLSPVTSHS